MNTNTKKLNEKQIENLISDLPTKSSKIRMLDSKGFTRSEISKILEIRYQHVRNVLITPLKNKS